MRAKCTTASPDVATTQGVGKRALLRAPLFPWRGIVASVSPPSEPGATGRSTPSTAPTVTELTGDSLRAALENAATWLELQAASINALNVFPVPDGDTGTNMSMTMRAAATAAADESADSAAARGALMGARGNSGVILSQLLRGFAEGAEGKDQLGLGDLANSFAKAAEA